MTMREVVKVQIFVNPQYGEVATVGVKGHRGKAQRLDHATRAAMGDDRIAFLTPSISLRLADGASANASWIGSGNVGAGKLDQDR